MPEHDMRVECAERFTKLEQTAKDYKVHENESTDVRDKVIKHDEILKGIARLNWFWLASSVTLIGALISIAVIWGALLNRVDNLEQYTKFILEHSYGVNDFLGTGDKSSVKSMP